MEFHDIQDRTSFCATFFLLFLLLCLLCLIRVAWRAQTFLSDFSMKIWAAQQLKNTKNKLNGKRNRRRNKRLRIGNFSPLCAHRPSVNPHRPRPWYPSSSHWLKQDGQKRAREKKEKIQQAREIFDPINSLEEEKNFSTCLSNWTKRNTKTFLSFLFPPISPRQARVMTMWERKLIKRKKPKRGRERGWLDGGQIEGTAEKKNSTEWKIDWSSFLVYRFSPAPLFQSDAGCSDDRITLLSLERANKWNEKKDWKSGKIHIIDVDD